MLVGLFYYRLIEEPMPFVNERLGTVAELELVVAWDVRQVEDADVAHHFADFSELRQGPSVRIRLKQSRGSREEERTDDAP
jgi:hypothetical protein